ncbi:putative pectin lyase a precursor protein [Botryosphaeria dothidea]|uniref:pectin lyase n=1 Tax=Botryosphaeria dothidea TaxID=55169 RepID=A0A8H4N4W5_9PEZI|nr:putative pectin lyase a precursor protein [Botryosphaeria dothidea]
MFGRSLLATACLASLVVAQSNVVGSATGFAAGVTGGGDATPATPADIDELVEWLTDDEPRVILLDKEYNFLESEGTKTEDGCRPDSNTCGSSGQDALDGPNWCSASYPTVSVTYDVAATNPIDVKSNKSVVGVGDQGVIRGKGFRFVNDVSNIIFQNVHVTELNPQYIWGGDAFQMSGCDLIWLDHVKISLIGRQFLVTGYETAGRVTISNSELDGQTSWSASCNDEHYWTMLFLGENDQITLANNYVHDTSGRSPKVGDKSTIHAVNNYFQTNKGHNFDIEEGAQILFEGNVFEDCKAPMTEAALAVTSGLFNTPTSSDASKCSSALGRDCQVNSLSNSGDFGSFTDTAVVDAVGAADSIWEAMAADEVAAYVKANAGIGKLSDSSSSTSTKSTSAESVEAADEDTSSSSAAPAATSSEAPASTSSAAAVETAASSSSSSSGSAVARYGQCGGQSYTGSTSCADGSTCTVQNDWYSQCL